MSKLVKIDWYRAIARIGAHLLECKAAYNLPEPKSQAPTDYAQQVFKQCRRDPSVYAWTNLVVRHALAQAFASEENVSNRATARAYYLAMYMRVNPEHFEKYKRELLAPDNTGELCALIKRTCQVGLWKELYDLAVAFAHVEAERQASVN